MTKRTSLKELGIFLEAASLRAWRLKEAARLWLSAELPPSTSRAFEFCCHELLVDCPIALWNPSLSTNGLGGILWSEMEDISVLLSSV